MRHSKSDYPEGVGDHDRPLAPRGEREAALAGDWLRDHVPTIDAVLCSSAMRTRQTLARSGITAPVTYRDELYAATPGTMLAEINTVADSVNTLLVLGHEPTVSHLALGLAGPGSDHSAAEGIRAKFPTSGIAVLGVDGAWAGVEPGSAELVVFHVPR